MKDLDFLISKAEHYDLVAERLNEETLKVHSPKFVFDSWLIKETETEMELWHMSKKNNLKKCSYHLQASVPKQRKMLLYKLIRKHNNYVAFHKNFNKINLVDRVLTGQKA